MDEQVRQLQAEWAARREAQDAEGYARLQRDKRNAVIAGAMIGFASTFATVQFTRRALFWHSFLLEALLGALAGYLLVRREPDPLKGVIFFAAAYMVSWLVRALGLDPSVLFANGDLRGVTMIQGNLLSLALTVSCGIAMGQIMRD